MKSGSRNLLPKAHAISLEFSAWICLGKALHGTTQHHETAVLAPTQHFLEDSELDEFRTGLPTSRKMKSSEEL